MRNVLVKILRDRALLDKNVFILTSDLGFKLFDSFREACPRQFINLGIAEQNMVGVAAGMSLSGKNVYCYTMVPFLTMRALEFIRIDICYHKLNVKLVGVGGGVYYGFEGVTHHGVEDLSIMRTLPGMTIIAPGDPIEAAALIEQSLDYPLPLYIRLGGNNDPVIHQSAKQISIGKGAIVHKGRDLTLMATGSMLPVAVEVAGILREKRYDPSVISLHTVKPLDEALIRQYASHSKAVFTIEEHSLIGGLGTAVSETLFEAGYHGIFKKFGLSDEYGKVVGCNTFIRNAHGLNPGYISSEIHRVLENDRKKNGI